MEDKTQFKSTFMLNWQKPGTLLLQKTELLQIAIHTPTSYTDTHTLIGKI